MSKTNRLASLLNSGLTLNAEQITRTTGLRNPGEAVRQLRQRGMCIYTNKNGYRLGTPTKRMVALSYAMGGDSLFKSI